MSEAPDWPTQDGLNFASFVSFLTWVVILFIIYICWCWNIYQTKSILVGIQFCEVFAILLSWIGMGPEAFVSYLHLFGGVASCLFAVAGLVLTFLRDFRNKDQASDFHSAMVWTTVFEYLPLCVISILINNWTLVSYNVVMMILNPISISEIVRSVELAFRDRLFKNEDEDYSETSVASDSEYEFPEPDFTCGPLDCFWRHIAIGVCTILALTGFIVAVVLGRINGIDIHWTCTDHLSVETCDQYKGLNDKWNSYESLVAFGIMMVPTFFFLSFYMCAVNRNSTNPKYSLAVIQCCEIAAMLTSWFNFGDVAWNEGGWLLGIASTFSAFLGLMCVCTTVSFKSWIIDDGKHREITELVYVFDGCACYFCPCFFQGYRQSTFEKHMAMSTIAEFFWFGIHAAVNHTAGWGSIFYAAVMMVQIFMTERYLLIVGAEYAKMRAEENDDIIEEYPEDQDYNACYC